MPAKNKQQKNAFWFYMQELIVVLKREGRVFPAGLADVVPIAHPRFKALDDKEKERFENMAKEYKKRMRGQPGDAIRQDNVGNIIAHRRDYILDYERDREKETKEMVRRWPEDIIEENFHFIDVQVLCKTPDDTYLPVEIALIEFNLKDGIRKCYHQFLKPGDIPSGMRYECMSKSEDTHRIPVDGHPDATNNFLSVQNSIENFLNPGGKFPHHPPVFALREEWNKTDYTLGYIRNNSCMGPRAATIKVYELESLFVALAEFSGKCNPSKGTAFDILTSTTHDYQQGLKCSYHEEMECQHCSLLWVRKFSYAMADAMSEYYIYDLKPHSHLPTLKGQQFSVTADRSDCWSSSEPQNSVQKEVYKFPKNMPKTASTLIPRMAQPAPVFRPPGAANLDYAVNMTTDARYQQQVAWRTPTPDNFTPSASRPSTRAPSPPAFEDEDLPTVPSQNTDLGQGREATWVPSKQSWSRRTTPASTPRATPSATPIATPIATPLVTPHHSPPRDRGAYFPDAFVQRNEMGPPPGFNPRPIASPTSARMSFDSSPRRMAPHGLPQGGVGGNIVRGPPPGFNSQATYGSQLEAGIRQASPHGWGGGDPAPGISLENDFPSLSMQSSPGRGRGSAFRR